jgi:hypothetical protein
MKKLLCQMVICVLICVPAGNLRAEAQTQVSKGLRIVVIEGEDAVNIVQQKTAVRPLVEVRDSNNLPVAGATVLFTLFRTGGNAAASFANGQSAVTVTTDAVGRAASSPLQAIGTGAVRIDVQATYQGQVATTTINQTNFATPADAAKAGRTPTQAAGAAAAGAAAGAVAAGGVAGAVAAGGRAGGAAGRGAGAGGAGAAGGAAAAGTGVGARGVGAAGAVGAGGTAAGTAGTVGVITGAVASSSGRRLSNITMQLLNQSGVVVASAVTARNGEFTLPSASYDTYTLQCVDRNKVIGTSSVTLKGEKEAVKITCASDAAAPFWKNSGVLTGLVAAAAALGATAIVASSGDASGSR